MTQAWPPWDRGLGYKDEHDYLSGDSREWGIDVSLKARTPVFAREPGTVSSYVASATDWPPGRLLFRLNRGGVVGFGHVNDLTAAGTHVAGGHQIATIG